jgi:hypothetical protein
MTYVCLSLYVLHYPFIYWNILSIIPLVCKLHCVTFLDWNLKLFTSRIPGLFLQHGHKLQVLLQNHLTWSKSKYHGHRKLQVIASKFFDMV